MKCQARQMSDQMQCNACGLVWDMNDPDPPLCKTRDGDPTLVDATAKPRYNCPTEAHDGEE